MPSENNSIFTKLGFDFDSKTLDKYKKGLETAKDKSKELGAGLQATAGKVKNSLFSLKGLFLGVTSALAIKSASNLENVERTFKDTFRNVLSEATRFSIELGKKFNVPLSETKKELSDLFQSIKSTGGFVDGEDSSTLKLTKKLYERARDISFVRGISIQESIALVKDALGGGVAYGEKVGLPLKQLEAIKKFGEQTELSNQGTKGKTLSRARQFTNNTARFHGAYKNETGSITKATQGLDESTGNLVDKFNKKLTPVYEQFVKGLTGVSNKLQSFIDTLSDEDIKTAVSDLKQIFKDMKLGFDIVFGDNIRRAVKLYVKAENLVKDVGEKAAPFFAKTTKKIREGLEKTYIKNKNLYRESQGKEGLPQDVALKSIRNLPNSELKKQNNDLVKKLNDLRKGKGATLNQKNIININTDGGVAPNKVAEAVVTETRKIFESLNNRNSSGMDS